MAGLDRFSALRVGWLARSLALIAVAAGLLVAMDRPADARVRFGIGIGFPLFGWHHPRYYAPPPPPIYYAPPPVYYPPPATYYAPPPTYYPPPAAYYPPPARPYYPAPGYASMLPPDALPASPMYQGPGGQTCREYSTTVYISGRPQPSYGTACLQPDGTWRLVN
jgi:hypothetical protein